jgi:uncharacterized protein with von Willebrand factor type A (vWA) domain
VLAQLGRDYRVILVGDAFMYPGELLDRNGASYYYHRNEKPGIEWLKFIRESFNYSVWLNPRPRSTWSNQSARLIQMLFPMYPLTLEGLDHAIRLLTGAEKAQMPVSELDFY